jgi:predicted dehydrogenase
MEKPLGVGLIGTGFGRRVQLPALSACPGVAVRVLASGRIERAEATARALGIPEVARDWPTAAVALSAVEPGEPVHTVELFGSRHALRIQGSGLWRAAPGGHRWEPVELPAAEPLPPGLPDTEWARGFLALARAAVEALRSGGPPPEEVATFEDGWCNPCVLDAARVSHAERRWVALPSLASP